MINAIISVRKDSTRLPGKCFLQLYDGYSSILEHVINRCRRSGLNPVVSTSLRDDEVVNACKLAKCQCFQGSADDKLMRWLSTCTEFNIKQFVTVDCDDPLFDPLSSKEQFSLLNNYDVIAPDMNAFLGSNGWAFNIDALFDICKKKSSNKTEMIWKHFPKELNVKTFDAHADPIEKNLRLTVDYIEDFWLIKTVIRELSVSCSRREIIEFFKQNPGLRKINEFRNAQWKLNQAKQL